MTKPTHPEHPRHGNQPQGGHHDQAHDVAKIGGRTVRVIALVAVAVLACLFVLGFWIRHERISKRERMAEQVRDQPLVVLVVRPKTTRASFDLTLPANVQAYASTALYARTNGYLAMWRADINDRVKKGDLMAVISAPDTDADLEQAKAALQQQETSRRLAVATDERYRALIATEGVTQEQLDQFKSSREQAEANVTAAAATVDRMKALVGFERIVAPFDGVVTARNYDVGALISATNIAPGQELFDLAEDDRLRVFVNIPQEYALLVHYDDAAELVLERNFPGHRFKGILKRSSGVLDPVTRTLHAELDLDNGDPAGRILPGMYGEVILSIHRDAPVLSIPTSALLFEAEGKEVAVVGDDNKVHFQKIVIGNDFGTSMEVLSGLKGGERIVANPGEQLADGITVSPTESAAGEPGGVGGQ